MAAASKAAHESGPGPHAIIMPAACIVMKLKHVYSTENMDMQAICMPGVDVRQTRA
jgi:hypothetical protein